jgi:serine/threonine protein kinase
MIPAALARRRQRMTPFARIDATWRRRSAGDGVGSGSLDDIGRLRTAATTSRKQPSRRFVCPLLTPSALGVSAFVLPSELQRQRSEIIHQGRRRCGTWPLRADASGLSVRSDIYSLGLILHELFTGKRAFDTNDVEKLKRKHGSGTDATPSSVTDDIDPAVERVILRCLEHKPAQRPQSVYQVLAALPGGDPLAAALAAGEVPSPDLIANARDAGGLRPPAALGLLAAMLDFLGITYFVYAGTTVMPERSPAELSVIAKQVLEEFG